MSSRRRSASVASNATSPSRRLSMWTARRSPGRAGARRVPVIHPHERRHVQRLVEVRPARREDVRVPLAPRRVRDLGDDRLDVLAGRVEAVVEADRVEAVPERAQLGEERGSAPPAGRRSAFRPRRGPRGRAGSHAGPEVVAATEAQQAGPRDGQPAAEQRRQLVEVEVEQRQPVAELASRLRSAGGGSSPS